METSLSLLERLRDGSDQAAWQRLDAIYRPLIQRWLMRDPDLADEADDILQEVMQVLVRELPGFQRQRTGSFRRWLRVVTAHRVLAHQRARRGRPQALGAAVEESPLALLKDPASDLSKLWDREHDQHVLRRLLELVEPQFEQATLAAFRRVVFDELPAAKVAEELNMSISAVYLAKSHVLKRLRQEAQGLVD
jgi:RNA polymerase sigma-70 factor (ECF subfamily)